MSLTLLEAIQLIAFDSDRLRRFCKRTSGWATVRAPRSKPGAAISTIKSYGKLMV
jgi:hypothetical protein